MGESLDFLRRITLCKYVIFVIGLQVVTLAGNFQGTLRI